MNIIDNDLLSIQESRILVENASEAHKILATFTQEKLDEIVEHIAKEIAKYTRELAVMSSEETDYGKWQDKYMKNRFTCEYLVKKLRGMRCVGIIREDKLNKTMDVGVPFGVITAICPATNPVSTTIYKTLIAIKSGNAIVFSPHPRAKQTIAKALDIMIEAAQKHGLPAGALAYLHTSTSSGASELMNHKLTSMIMITGVPELLDCACKSGKPVIYGGLGNGPVFVERTADLKQAVKDIISSKTFDNGMVLAAEQSIIADGCISETLIQELQNNGGYFMNEQEAKMLGDIFYCQDGSEDAEIVGKSAITLAKRAGFTVPTNTKVLIAQQEYVSHKIPFSRMLLCPVLTYYVEADWRHACEKCIELLLGETRGHTLTIHSKDEEVIRQFALKKPVDRVLVNTPATLGGMGATTNLFPSMTLGGGTAGYMGSDNISPMNLIYIRKVGYGVR